MSSIDELWRQVAEAPDDVAARLVLADALVEAGPGRLLRAVDALDPEVVILGGQIADAGPVPNAA